MSVRGLDPLVVLLLRLDDVEAGLLVEVDGTLVVHLDVEEDGVDVAVLFDDAHNVVEHRLAHPEPAVGGQAAQGHDVELPRPRVGVGVDAAADGAHDDVVEEGQLGEFASLEKQMGS